MKEYSPDEKALLMEYAESEPDCPDPFMDYYLEERRHEYYVEWFDFLEALDKE